MERSSSSQVFEVVRKPESIREREDHEVLRLAREDLRGQPPKVRFVDRNKADRPEDGRR